MQIRHSHNLSSAQKNSKPYGIRVSLPKGDAFIALLGSDWAQFHWFATPEERDIKLDDMASEHLYSRRGDRPSLIFKPGEKSEKSDSQ